MVTRAPGKRTLRESGKRSLGKVVEILKTPLIVRLGEDKEILRISVQSVMLRAAFSSLIVYIGHHVQLGWLR